MIRKNGTEYQEVEPGDSVNLAFPNSTSRRGRLGKTKCAYLTNRRPTSGRHGSVPDSKADT